MKENDIVSMHLFDKADKGKDVCLVRQSNSKFLNFPYENWVETVLLLVSNLCARCQVLLNRCHCITPHCRFMRRYVFMLFEHAKLKTKLSLHGNDTWRWTLVFVDLIHATPVSSERSSWNNSWSSRETLFPHFYCVCILLGLLPLCTQPWIAL